MREVYQVSSKMANGKSRSSSLVTTVISVGPSCRRLLASFIQGEGVYLADIILHTHHTHTLLYTTHIAYFCIGIPALPHIYGHILSCLVIGHKTNYIRNCGLKLHQSLQRPRSKQDFHVLWTGYLEMRCRWWFVPSPKILLNSWSHFSGIQQEDREEWLECEVWKYSHRLTLIT